MMKIKPRKEQYNDVTYNYFDLESNKVCFMFSGTGYTYEKPLLYYSTELMLELGYDVVQVCYSFNSKQFEQEPEAISAMVYNAANPIVEYVLSTKSYTEAVYIGKSLGTLPITDFYMQQSSSVPSRYVLLTPLLSLEHVMKNLLGRQAFLAIGTADPHYSKESLEQLSSHELLIIENADHSLEIANHTVESVILCQSLLTGLKAYL
ncbi:alpha/beta hydrolase [Lysinibacillus sp. CTST325]